MDITRVLENGQGTASRFEFYLEGSGEVLVDNLVFHNNGGSSLVSNGDFQSGTTGWTMRGNPLTATGSRLELSSELDESTQRFFRLRVLP